MQQPKKERVRIFALARELGMESKDLLALCQQHGLDIKNQLSTIEPEVRDQILQLVKRGSSQAAAAPAPAPAAPVVPPTTRKLVDLDHKSRSAAPAAAATVAVTAAGSTAPSASATTDARPEPASPAATAAAVAEPTPTAATAPAPPPAATIVASPPSAQTAATAVAAATTSAPAATTTTPSQPAAVSQGPVAPPPAKSTTATPAATTRTTTTAAATKGAPTETSTTSTTTTTPATPAVAASTTGTPTATPAAKTATPAATTTTATTTSSPASSKKTTPAAPAPATTTAATGATLPEVTRSTAAPAATTAQTTTTTTPTPAITSPAAAAVQTHAQEKQPIPADKTIAPVAATTTTTTTATATPPAPAKQPGEPSPAAATTTTTSTPGAASSGARSATSATAPRGAQQTPPVAAGGAAVPPTAAAPAAGGATNPPARPTPATPPSGASSSGSSGGGTASPAIPNRDRPMRNLSSRPTPASSGTGTGTGGGGPAGQGGTRTPGQSPRPGARGTTTGGGTGNFRSSPPAPGSAGSGGAGGAPGNRPQPASPQQRQPQDQSAAKPAQPQQPGGARRIADIPPELLKQLQQGRETPISVKEIEERLREKEKQQTARPGAPGAPTTQPTTPEPDADDDDRGRKGGAKKHTPPGTTAGGVAGRADRHKERTERQAQRKTEEQRRGGKAVALLDDDEPRHRKARGHKPPKPQGTQARKGKIPVTLPITVRSISEALGRKVGEVLFKLIGHGMSPTTTINSQVNPEIAELLALDYNVELEIKRDIDIEQDLIDLHKQVDKEEDLQPRAPIVVIMGHVDHGKTSLLDRIRESNVVDTEAGGITQVIRAWRVVHEGKPVTFLDTPGHEAFTKMRARGANVTDIAVIVVAANDGVMPQTEEAISHAKAAEVSIVVAINKVDVPDANIRKTEQQLYGLGLIPDTMGGDVPFVYTSAKTGKGIDELLENLSVVAELKELKANPNKSAQGTCLEAHLSEKEGVQATLLVQDGTLRPGDIVLCGASYGTVRKMYDDHNRPIEEAGPSVPVRIIGLDDVPLADDPFLVVKDVATAREIAEKRKHKLAEKSLKVRAPVTLENLRDAEISELNIILKAEARGSIEAIRNELEKLHHDEVRVKILHTAIGAINASDVQLALTSPEDTLILGFNVVPDNEAKSLAEERGIQIREYDIIYKLADDIRSALEGKLKPREEVVFLGRANVRETFKISRVGTIAGCFVTQGTIERSAKVRVIRGGVVVYPPAEKTAQLESLKRFKDDVREVREGMECGLKIAGYDDIKVDDVIEAYRVDQIKRSL